MDQKKLVMVTILTFFPDHIFCQPSIHLCGEEICKKNATRWAADGMVANGRVVQIQAWIT